MTFSDLSVPEPWAPTHVGVSTAERGRLRAAVTDRFTAAGLHDRLAHSLGVAHAARRIADRARMAQHFIDTVEVAGLVHDLGYTAATGSGLHFFDGADLLGSLSAPEDVIWLVRWHSTALWEARVAGMPDVPETVQGLPGANPHRLALLGILSVADFTTTPTGLPCTLAQRRAGIEQRYPDRTCAVRVALAQGWPWLVREAYALVDRGGLDLSALR